MKCNPYLNFDGNCAEAFAFYASVLGAAPAEILRIGESPMADKMPAELHQRVMHACLTAGELVLMGADCQPDNYQPPQGISVALHVDEPADAERLFAALAEGGEVQMPLQPTFWARAFGSLSDRFGISWLINCEAPAQG